MNERFTTKQIRSCRLNTKANSLQITIITVQKRVLSDSVNHSLTLLAFTWIMQKHLFLSFHRASLLPRSSKRSYNLLNCAFPTTVSSSHADKLSVACKLYILSKTKGSRETMNSLSYLSVSNRLISLLPKSSLYVRYTFNGQFEPLKT